MINLQNLVQNCLAGKLPSKKICIDLLESTDILLPDLLQAAYSVRKATWGNRVRVHMLNNAQNGSCPEDCKYCPQANNAKSDIAGYPMKGDQEIIDEAKRAYNSGAYRYCMVFSGRGPRKKRVERMARLIKDIKKEVPVEVCLSAGLLEEEDAKILKNAGLDRYNHNLNTSKDHYKKICSTHTYEDRLQTLNAANSAGIKLCSGFIAGMKEQPSDLVDVAFKLKDLDVASVPVNFLIPIKGTALEGVSHLTPNFCLRLLCMMRFVLPKAEIRMAAGRELHLKGNQILGLFPANSLFIDGYLNVRGEYQSMITQIEDAGFKIEQEGSSIKSEEALEKKQAVQLKDIVKLKDQQALHPTLN